MRAPTVSPGPPPMIRVLIADDDAEVATALADSLGAVPDLEVVGVAPDAESALRMADDRDGAERSETFAA